MDKHPEQKSDEVYLGNTTLVDGKMKDDLLFLRTARLGNVTYDIDGNIFDGNKEPRCKPLFINVSEQGRYNQVMEERFRKICRGW